MNIEWRFNGITIKKCPKCGRWGNLVSKGRKRISNEACSKA